MTIACLVEERWEAADGAPPGPSFDITIPSSRPGRGPYRMVRDEVTGAVLHMPRCERWIHRGPCACRHVTDAAHRSEQPTRAFYDRADAALNGSTWAFHMPNLPEPVQDVLREVVAARDEARSQMLRNAAGDRARAESDAFNAQPLAERSDQAIAELGGVQ